MFSEFCQQASGRVWRMCFRHYLLTRYELRMLNGNRFPGNRERERDPVLVFQSRDPDYLNLWTLEVESARRQHIRPVIRGMCLMVSPLTKYTRQSAHESPDESRWTEVESARRRHQTATHSARDYRNVFDGVNSLGSCVRPPTHTCALFCSRWLLRLRPVFLLDLHHQRGRKMTFAQLRWSSCHPQLRRLQLFRSSTVTCPPPLMMTLTHYSGGLLMNLHTLKRRPLPVNICLYRRHPSCLSGNSRRLVDSCLNYDQGWTRNVWTHSSFFTRTWSVNCSLVTDRY